MEKFEASALDNSAYENSGKLLKGHDSWNSDARLESAMDDLDDEWIKEWERESGKDRYAPVSPTRPGYYPGIYYYLNEEQKIRSKKGAPRERYYAFPFVDGTFGIVEPGDVSPGDGQAVTEADIKWLHRSRDREVYHNNKYRKQESEDYEFLEMMDDEELKAAKHLPNRYEEMKEQFDQRYLSVSIEGFVNEDGEDCTDHLRCFASPRSVESQLGLIDDFLAEAFEEAKGQMTDRELEVFELVYEKELPRTTVARMLGVSEGTVRYQLAKAVSKLEENPVIMDHVRRGREQYEKHEVWKARQKKKRERRKLRNYR